MPEPAQAAVLPDVAEVVGLAHDGDWEALERLAQVLLDVDRVGDIAAARQALTTLIAHPRVVVRLDETARSPHWAPAASWAERAAGQAAAPTGGVVAWALASMHPDGRVREECVVRLVAAGDPVGMAFVVLRTTDWAPQVRVRARAGMTQLLFADPARFLPTTVPAASAVNRRLRADFASMQVRAAMQAAPRAVYQELLSCPDRDVRRLAVEASVAGRKLALNVLLGAARDEDGWIRSCAAEAVAREAVWTGQHKVLRTLAASPAPQVRALGLTGLIRAGQTTTAADYLGDDSAIVRAIARDAARRIGADPRERYREVVSTVSTTPTAGALMGLGECGTADDAPILLRWLDHPSPRVRAAAVVGLRHLSQVPVDRLAPMLADSSAKVVRQVVSALRPVADSLPAEHLWALVEHPLRHIRVAGHTLLRQRGFWTGLRAGLVLASDRDDTLARLARASLSALARVTQPPAGGQPDLAPLLARVGSSLKPEVRWRLHAVVSPQAHRSAPVKVRCQAVRWAGHDPQPGIVEFRLTDVYGAEWIFIDKTAVIDDTGQLTPDASYPIEVGVACEIMNSHQHPSQDQDQDQDQTIITINTQPWRVETINAYSTFHVRADQLIWPAWWG